MELHLEKIHSLVFHVLGAASFDDLEPIDHLRQVVVAGVAGTVGVSAE